LPPNTPVTVTAAAHGGIGPFEYQFWLKDTSGSYTLVQPFSSTATWSWNSAGNPAGIYSVAAQVKTAGTAPPNGFDSENVVSITVAPPALQTMDIVTTPNGPQVAGAPVAVAATNVSGGSGSYQFQFWLKDTAGVYTLVQPFSASNVWNWNTVGLAPGVYSVAVQAKSVGSSSPNGYDVERVVSYVIAPPAAQTMDILAAPVSPQTAGSTVTISATNVGGGSGSYQYQFWLKDTFGVYTLAQPFSSSSSWNWDTTGLPAGTYYVAVQAKSSGSISPNGYDVERVVGYVVVP
jgi:hypothetical protein